MTEDEVREEIADQIEAPGSPVCDCQADAGTPVSPRTGKAVAHRCDCAAVRTSAVCRKGRSLTRHARECGCGGVYTG